MMPRMPKKTLSAWVDEDFVELVRNVAYWDRETVSEIVEEAVRHAIEERVRVRGSPYPDRPKKLRRGRPPASKD